MKQFLILRLAFIAVVLGLFVFVQKFCLKPAPDAQSVVSQPSVPVQPLADAVFPKKFFFGTASSDFQTTGGNGKSDWAALAGNDGTDFSRHYREDFDQAGKIGIQMHRLSLDWARLEPREGRFNRKEAARYRRIFRHMRARGVEPMICLNHFDLPQWFADKGGWENPKAARYYARYARFVARSIGKPVKVRWWLTFNEPQIAIKESYITGGWPPHKSIASYSDEAGLRRCLRATSHLLESHRAAYRQIHAVMGRRAMVGWASWSTPFYPSNPAEPVDVMSATAYRLLSMYLMDDMIDGYRDFVGLNYYSSVRLKMYVNRTITGFDHQHPVSIGWDYTPNAQLGSHPLSYSPRGLYDMIMAYRDTGLPIVITENGVSDTNDTLREQYLVTHLAAVHKALAEGARVVGYMYWTLADSSEWDGNFATFGLLEVDREHHMERHPRALAGTYRTIIKKHRLPRELLERYRPGLP